MAHRFHNLIDFTDYYDDLEEKKSIRNLLKKRQVTHLFIPISLIVWSYYLYLLCLTYPLASSQSLLDNVTHINLIFISFTENDFLLKAATHYLFTAIVHTAIVQIFASLIFILYLISTYRLFKFDRSSYYWNLVIFLISSGLLLPLIILISIGTLPSYLIAGQVLAILGHVMITVFIARLIIRGVLG